MSGQESGYECKHKIPWAHRCIRCEDEARQEDEAEQEKVTTTPGFWATLSQAGISHGQSAQGIVEAFTGLQARVAAVEAERDTARRVNDQHFHDSILDDGQMKDERDAALVRVKEYDAMKSRAVAAEQQRDGLREALESVVHGEAACHHKTHPKGECFGWHVENVIRKALAAIPAPDVAGHVNLTPDGTTVINPGKPVHFAPDAVPRDEPKREGPSSASRGFAAAFPKLAGFKMYTEAEVMVVAERVREACAKSLQTTTLLFRQNVALMVWASSQVRALDLSALVAPKEGKP